MAPTTPIEDLRAAYASPESLWLALGGPERSERRFRAAWIAFCLACGVLGGSRRRRLCARGLDRHRDAAFRPRAAHLGRAPLVCPELIAWGRNSRGALGRELDDRRTLGVTAP